MDDLRFDFREGPEAIERLNRTAIMLVDGAIGEIINLGYHRDKDMVTIDFPEGDGKWMIVNMRGKAVYEVQFVVKGGRIYIVGNWVEVPRKRSWVVRAWRRIFR